MPTLTGTLSDGTVVTVDGPFDASLPIVILLHGMGGRSADMTAPATAYPGMAFNRGVVFPSYKDEGLHPTPPLVPVARFYTDPPSSSLTSWNQALLAAGLTTITYNQRGPLISDDVAQLNLLVREVLILGTVPPNLPPVSHFRVAFVAHSRGGIVARSFLTGAGANPDLPGFLSRVTSLITLHSPHTGSGVATLAATVAGLLNSITNAFTAAGLPTAAAFTTGLSGLALTPARGELVLGSPTLAAIAAAEPVAGVTYHTFGGISMDFIRLWADAYTPDSTIPLPVPFPLFHWGSRPTVVGVPLNAASFLPVLGAPVPFVSEIVTLLVTLAATTPELTPGLGDLLVTDARARLPFSTSHTTNFLNHLEALSDPTLQAQVTALLLRLRSPKDQKDNKDTKDGKDSKDKDKEKDHKDDKETKDDNDKPRDFSQLTDPVRLQMAQLALRIEQVAQAVDSLSAQVAQGKSFITPEERPPVGEQALKQDKPLKKK
ncbi:MAG: hypothetical protein OJF51_004185 [Nitrospira sp.]|jgi:hypothetical protein|nr:MAG: hypothetical protein OJF51_004185 [Nitrospira sp.]